jgi:hypothetical protein
MEEINNDDNIEKQFQVYGRDINGNYIIRKRDKCIVGIIMIASFSVFIYNLYLISNVIYMTSASNT